MNLDVDPEIIHALIEHYSPGENHLKIYLENSANAYLVGQITACNTPTFVIAKPALDEILGLELPGIPLSKQLSSFQEFNLVEAQFAACKHGTFEIKLVPIGSSQVWYGENLALIWRLSLQPGFLNYNLLRNSLMVIESYIRGRDVGTLYAYPYDYSYHIRSYETILARMGYLHEGGKPWPKLLKP